MWVSLIIVVILLIIAGAIIGLFNTLIRKRNQVSNAWSDIDVQLKRRYDLIPNLVETVKGYKNFEASTLENVTKARTAAMGAGSPDEKAKAENALSGTLKTLFAVAESYPDLKASQNFQQLQTQLSTLENDIQSARRYYNAASRDFNDSLQVFPNNLIAGMFNFKASEFFGVEESEREPVKVKF